MLGVDIPVPQQQPFVQRFQQGVTAGGDGNRNSKGLANLVMLANQDIQDHAVDLVIGAVVGDDLDFRFGLTKPVDPSITLFMTGRVPAQVIMDDGIKGVLQVDPFAQAIGADEDAFFDVTQRLDSLFPIGGGDRAGDGDRGDPFGESLPKLFGEIFGGGDKSAKQDRAMPIIDQRFDDLDDLDQFGIVIPLKFIGGAGHVQQSPTFAVDGPLVGPHVGGVGTGEDIGGIRRFIDFIVEHERTAELIDFIGGRGIERANFVAKRGGGGSGTAGECPQHPEGRPPADTLPDAGKFLRVLNHLACIAQDAGEEVLVG